MTEENKKESIEIGRINFGFSITRDEANEVINNPKGTVSKKLRKYMISILRTGCKKMLETKSDENVTNCKLDIEK